MAPVQQWWFILIVYDCVDTPCWAEDITTTKRKLTISDSVPYPESHFQPGYNILKLIKC